MILSNKYILPEH